MSENEKDTQKPCSHNYKFKDTRVSNDTTEYVKTWVCTKCGDKCEKRSVRMGAREVPRVIA